MQQFLALTVAGVVTYGCVYALTALGLVVTYTTSGIFNFAQGAVGMIGAFLYWQLAIHFGLPAWLAFLLIGFVLAPATGATLERFLMSRVSGGSEEAKLTVTIGLLLFLLAVATTSWNAQTPRIVPQFFRGDQVSLGGVVITYHQLVVVGVTVLVALGLRLFLYRTRPGIATRAVVDDRELASLAGATPNRYAMLGWAMGSSLAAIAGILLAPTVNLDINTLTLLVINGYAAAMVGRLRSLPLTFAGAILLGLIQSYAIGYLPVGNLWTTLYQIIPMIYLFIAILVLPQARAPIARQRRVRVPRVAGMKESLLTSVVFLVVAAVGARSLSIANLNYADRGAALAIIMLSLVLLTGYAGQVSLCQLTFAGLGGYAMSKVGGIHGSLLGILAAVGLSAAVGALVALPTLRLRGLYLALATFAFAYGMDNAFFGNATFFGDNGTLSVARPHLPGFSLGSNRTYFISLCVVFALVGIGVLALRRSLLGRRLLAMNDSPAACLTLGVDATRAKLLAFTISAGIAGLGGALYGGAQGAIGPSDFSFLLSLTLLLMAVVWGVRTVGGMFLAGISLALGPLLQTHLSNPQDVVELLVGLAAIGIAQNPEGTFGGNTPLQRWRDRQSPAVTVPPAGPDRAESLTGAAR